MDHNDRNAIEGLFGKLSQVERQAGPRDPEAEGFIRERLAAQPGAPYFMAQTIVVQEQALDAAQQRIEALEHELANRPQSGGGGLLSSLFGSGSRSSAQTPSPASRQTFPQGGIGAAPGAQAHAGAAQSGPWGQQGVAPQGMGQQGFGTQRGGGFLAGAAQTAMGVAGGVLLGNAIAGMFAGDANAAEQPAEQPAPAEDQGADDGDFGMDDTEF